MTSTQLEIPGVDLDRFALTTRPLMYAVDMRTEAVTFASDKFRVKPFMPKDGFGTYDYDTYTSERGYHTRRVDLDFMKKARTPWKPPAQGKTPYQPTGFKPGAMVTLQPPPKYVGEPITGQVWGTAPRPNCVWVAADSGYYLVDSRDGIVVDKWIGDVKA